MERLNGLRNDLKHQSIYAKRPMNLKESWDHYNQGDNETFLGGFSWPPRSYACAFCKREFRSAQALGGHMNVHRRDRARLRQSPPRDGQFYSPGNLLNLNLDPNPNLNPNPNPNISSSSQPSSPQKIFNNPPFSSTLPPLLSPSISALSSPSSHTEILEWGPMDHVGALNHHIGANSAKMKSQKTLFDGFSRDKEFKAVKKGEIVGLNLEIGLLCESNVDDLDLELRLGYS